MLEDNLAIEALMAAPESMEDRNRFRDLVLAAGDRDNLNAGSKYVVMARSHYGRNP